MTGPQKSSLPTISEFFLPGFRHFFFAILRSTKKFSLRKMFPPCKATTLTCSSAPWISPWLLLLARNLLLMTLLSGSSGLFVKQVGLWAGSQGRGRTCHFWVCGEQRHAKTDVCVMDNHDRILLLVQEHLEGTDPEPQPIAEAIAAFYNNNNTRMRILTLDPLQSKVIPGITMRVRCLHAIRFRSLPTLFVTARV